jgi:Cu+-exporting ATPase
MHPEIRQVGPGSCPICGMALEPELVTLDSGPNPELDRHDAALLDRLALTAPRVSRNGPASDRLTISSGQKSNWLQFAAGDAGGAVGGWPFFERGWAVAQVSRNLNMFTLIAMGTGVAWIYSVVAHVRPAALPAAFRDHDGAVAVYFEAAAVITVLVLLGQVLELRAREQTSARSRRCWIWRPRRRAHLNADGSDEDVAASISIAVGDRCACAPARRCRSMASISRALHVDESMVTGESMPVTKGAGAKVIGGTLNQTGGFVMRAEKVGRDTMLSQIVQMVAQAQRSRAPIQRLADQASRLVRAAVIAWRCSPSSPGRSGGPEPRLPMGWSRPSPC